MSLAVACEMGEAVPTSPSALPNTLRLSDSPSSCLPYISLQNMGTLRLSYAFDSPGLEA